MAPGSINDRIIKAGGQPDKDDGVKRTLVIVVTKFR